MPYTQAQHHLAQYIDQHQPTAQQYLKELVQTPSDNPPGDCRPIAELITKHYQALGFQVEQHTVPNETVHAANMQSVTNLIVRAQFGDGTGPTVALNAHGDVVPPGLGWSMDPYGGEIKDGWLYGRGAAVSKSDIVSYAYALKALQESQAELNGTVELHITFDEETGGLVGPGWLLEHGLSKPDYAICAAFSYNVIVAHNGCLHLEIRLRGQSAHAAVPSSWHDAIEALVPVLERLYHYRDSLQSLRSTTPGIDTPTFIVGLIKGGINTNVVADEVVLRIDRRILPEEDPLEVEAELTRIIQQSVAPLEGIRVQVDRILLASPLTPTPESRRLAEQLAQHATEIMGTPVPANVGLPLYTDARLYSERGIPTIMYGAGPRTVLEANGHRADERVPLDTLGKASKVIAFTLLELLAADPQNAS